MSDLWEEGMRQAQRQAEVYDTLFPDTAEPWVPGRNEEPPRDVVLADTEADLVWLFTRKNKSGGATAPVVKSDRDEA